MPAQQGFHADHLAAFEGDLRLVMHAELLPIQGFAQSGFEGQDGALRRHPFPANRS